MILRKDLRLLTRLLEIMLVLIVSCWMWVVVQVKNIFCLLITIIPLSVLSHHVIFLSIAYEHIISNQLKNCHLVNGIAEKLPFKSGTFNVVMSILSWWSASEMYRVLQRDGVFLIECLGPKDKTEFTIFFGKG